MKGKYRINRVTVYVCNVCQFETLEKEYWCECCGETLEPITSTYGKMVDEWDREEFEHWDGCE